MSSSVCRIVLFVVVFVCLADKIYLQNTNDDRQCVDTPAGNVSLVLDVRGTPGPEGPRGLRGPRGKQGETGVKGDRGVQGEKGVRGDVGLTGPTGLTGKVGSKGQKGARGGQGLIGPTGPTGPTGPQGPPGEPGDTVLTEDKFNRVVNNVANKLNESIIAELVETNTGLNSIVHTLNDAVHKLKEQVHTLEQIPFTLCNITSYKWRRIAYFDTTLGHSCPSGLRTFTNTTTNQTACGTPRTGPVCVSMNFSTGGDYTNVCGRATGYQYSGSTTAFYHHRFKGQNTINSVYVDGVSITKGSPRQHLWTYAAGLSETFNKAHFACPCARSDYDPLWVPDFVGNNYYCESGFVGHSQGRITWEDPLWDGQGCYASGNRCCDRYGWFHRLVPSSSDDVEVRWCKYYSSIYKTDILTDQLEIWVM